MNRTTPSSSLPSRPFTSRGALSARVQRTRHERAVAMDSERVRPDDRIARSGLRSLRSRRLARCGDFKSACGTRVNESEGHAASVVELVAAVRSDHLVAGCVMRKSRLSPRFEHWDKVYPAASKVVFAPTKPGRGYSSSSSTTSEARLP